MKYKQQPTQHERVMREDDFIISKTDLKGRITYCNRIFIEFSGYSEAELLGAQHNIIRHPDMPRGVFQFLWNTLGQPTECFAYVKNMCRDGAFYWVFANVTPSLDAAGQVEGYFSARRKPSPGAVSAVSDIYQLMRNEEQRVGPRDACAASVGLLTGLLNQQGTSYEKFILAL